MTDFLGQKVLATSRSYRRIWLPGYLSTHGEHLQLHDEGLEVVAQGATQRAAALVQVRYQLLLQL